MSDGTDGDGGQCSAVAVPETESTEEEPVLRRPIFNYAVVDSFKLKTVTIEPFTPDLFQNSSIQSWLIQSVEFDIRKNDSGKSMALIHFDTEDMGESAFIDLKQTIGKQIPNIKVTHPHAPSTNACTCRDMMDFVFHDKTREEVAPYLRTIILEDVPNSVQLDKILEIFPDAKNILDFRDDPVSRGIITFELPCLERCIEALNSAEGLTVDDHAVRLSKYANRANKWNRLDAKKAKKAREIGEDTDPKPLSDEDRIVMCTQYKELKDEATAIFDRTDIFSQEKKAESTRLTKLIKPYHDRLAHDTFRRVSEGQTTMPEPEMLIIGVIKTSLLRATSENNEPKTVAMPSATLTATQLTPAAKEAVYTKMAEREALLQKAKREAAERNKQATQALMIKARANQLGGGGLKGGRGTITKGGNNVGARGGRGFGGRGGRGGGGFTARGGGGFTARGGGGFGGRGGGWRARGGGRGFGRGDGAFGRGRASGRGNQFSFSGGNRDGGDFYDNDWQPHTKRVRGDHFGEGPMTGYTASDAQQFNTEQSSFGGGSGRFMSTSNAPAGPLEERLLRLEEMQRKSLAVQTQMLENTTRRF